MAKPPKKMGRPPTGKRKRQVFAFLEEKDADWFMNLPPKQRSAWLAEQIETAQKGTSLPTPTAHPAE